MSFSAFFEQVFINAQNNFSTVLAFLSIFLKTNMLLIITNNSPTDLNISHSSAFILSKDDLWSKIYMFLFFHANINKPYSRLISVISISN